MKILKIFLAIFFALEILNYVLFHNILVFFLNLIITIMLFIAVRANRKNKQYELLDILSTGWFILCELIPLWYKFAYNINIFQKFDLDKILNFILLGPIILLILTGLRIIRIKYKE